MSQSKQNFLQSDSRSSRAQTLRVQGLRWLRRHRLSLSIVAAVLLLYALLGFLLVPQLARSEIQKFVRDDLGRRVTIGTLKFNPFTLTARADRVALTEADGEAIASVGSLLVNLELSSLLHLALTFKEVRIDQPQVHLIIFPDRSVNLAKLAPQKAAPGKASTLPHVRITSFVVHRGLLKFEDRTREEPFATTLSPIEFALRDFRTEPRYENAYHFSASTPAQERFDWTGEFSLQPVGSTGRFAVEHLQAATLAAYLQEALPFELRAGSFDLGGSYALQLDGGFDLRIELPSLKTQAIAIAPRGGDTQEEPWITIPSANISGVAVALADHSVNVGAVEIGDAQMTVWREADGSINLRRLFAPAATAQAPVENAQAPPQSASSWRLNVNDLSVKNASVTAEDRSVNPAAHLKVAPVDLKLSHFATDANSATKVESDIGFDAKGHLHSAGEVRLQPLGANLALELSDFDLTPLQPYIALKSDVVLTEGRASAQTKLTYDSMPANKQPHLKLTGEAQIADLKTQDKILKQDFVKWRVLEASGLEFTFDPNALVIQRIRALEPYGRVAIASNRTLNISEVLKPERSESSAANTQQNRAAAAQPMPMRIRTVVIENGSANFADYSVEPSFSTGIQDLKGSIQGLSSNSKSRAQIKLDGSVDRYAPVTITGEVNFLSAAVYSDVSMDFRNMDLTTFNPYSGKYAGYDIAKGKLSTKLNYKIRDRQVDGQHHLVVEQLEFGKETGSKDAVSIPVKLAAALLKNRDGVIELDLPVSGNLNDPEFKLGAIIGRALLNLLGKAVTAPFALLGSLFGGGGGEELAYVDFNSGSAELPPSENDKLGKLARALNERPQLKLDVPSDAQSAADADAFARAALEREVAAEIKKPASDPEGAQKQQLAALKNLYQKEFKQAPSSVASANAAPAEQGEALKKALLTRYAPTPEQLSDLSRQRAESIRTALVSQGQIDPERIYFTTENAPAKTDNGQVRLELKLE